MRTNNVMDNGKRLAPLPGISWRGALGLVLGAASRVHHYRDVHTRMMRDAMCKVDCGTAMDGCDDE